MLNEKNWIKTFGFKENLKYHLYFFPKEFIRALFAIAKKDHILNEMHWLDYIDLARGIADMKAGRLYRYIGEGSN